jgi:hypothetical protein
MVAAGENVSQQVFHPILVKPLLLLLFRGATWLNLVGV